MLTPQEVEERAFPKAKRGGYDMQDVDNFLDELTQDYTELYKENAVLKRKMKVLADKITEYQETEGAMRATLLTAQKMATEMVEEAKTKRTQMLEEAENIVKARTADLSNLVAEEKARLKSAKASLAEMVGTIRELLAHEQEFLAGLPEPEVEPDEEPAAEDAADAVVSEIGDSISRMLSDSEEDEQTEEAEVTEETEAAEESEVTEEAAPAEEQEVSAEETKGEEELSEEEPTRRLDLSELRFGRNYEIK